jgi:hypothetical protein
MFFFRYSSINADILKNDARSDRRQYIMKNNIINHIL